MKTLTIDQFMPAGDAAAAARAERMADPRKEILAGGALAALIVLGFGGWAAASRLDAAVVGQGVVRVADARQVLQAPAGGVVSRVLVANGARVRAGQVLVEFTTTEAAAQERSLAARVFGLQAEVARLQADLRGAREVPEPREFVGLAGPERELALEALASERAQFAAQRALDASEAAVLRQRGAQIRHQIGGYRQRLDSANRQVALNRQELDAYQQLLDRGLATRPRVLALQRSAAGLEGEAGATIAEMSRLNTQIGETVLQASQMRNDRATRSAERLHQALNDLQATLPQWHAARAQLQRMVVRAPFDGTVSAAQMPFAGAVTQPGTRLMEIVPQRGSFSIEMRVPLAEAGELRRGMAAQVRLSGAAGHMLPALHGTVERVSEDSVEDDRTGAAFYTASVAVSRDEMARAARLTGAAGGVRPGAPVEVMVPTRARTALDFLLEPLFARTGTMFTQR